MNLRKLKLALTVGLINSTTSDNPLKSAQSLMEKYQTEAGKYQGTIETSRTQLNDNLEKSTHALKFDNCTLDVDLISDSRASKSLIQGFNLHAN